MERPRVIKGCILDDSFNHLYRSDERYDYLTHNEEAIALVVKGGVCRVSDIVKLYPEYIDPAQLAVSLATRGPPNNIIDVVESVCCIKPKAVGKELVFAATKPLRLEVRFARLHIYYVVNGNRYKRVWKISKRWKVDVKLIPLKEALIDFIASEKYLQNLYPIEPPDRVIISFSDGTDVVLVFDGDKPRVELNLSGKPSLLWFAKKPEDIVKELLS